MKTSSKKKQDINSMSDRDFLDQLDDVLWKYEPYANPSRTGPRGRLAQTRTITKVEWERVQSILAKGEFICMMGNSEFGFQIGMSILESFPYPHIPPAPLLWIAEKTLPWYDEEKRSPTEDWNRAWEEFSQFTHSDKNRQLLKFFKLPEQKNKTHYEY